MIWKTKTPTKKGFYFFTSFKNGSRKTKVLFVDEKKLIKISKYVTTETDAQIWEKATDGEIDVDFWSKIEEPTRPFDPCDHPVEKLTKSYSSHTGNYDPTSDVYIVSVKCECGAFWSASTYANDYDRSYNYNHNEEYIRLHRINCKEEKGMHH